MCLQQSSLEFNSSEAPRHCALREPQGVTARRKQPVPGGRDSAAPPAAMLVQNALWLCLVHYWYLTELCQSIFAAIPVIKVNVLMT